MTRSGKPGRLPQESATSILHPASEIFVKSSTRKLRHFPMTAIQNPVPEERFDHPSRLMAELD